jgi:hypothetical protein
VKARRVTLALGRSPLEEAFYVPETVLDAGRVRDYELAACRLFLAWQNGFPHVRRPVCEVEGLPAESAALNKALFRSPKPSKSSSPKGRQAGR